MRKIKGGFIALLSAIPLASSQVTGTSNSASVTGLITHLIGIEISQPYEALGVAATLGVMWASVYIIFKTAIQFMDQELGDNYNNYFADAVGLESSDDKNLLAVLTLLVTLSIVGTAGFAGIVYNWQSMILLLFAFMVLAGTMLVMIGGTGGIIGGSAFLAGKSAKVSARGVNELQDAINSSGAVETGDAGSPPGSPPGGPPGDDSSGEDSDDSSDGGTGDDTGDGRPEINSLVDYVNNFDHVTNQYNTWEAELTSRLKNDIEDTEPLDITNEEVRVSFFVPSIGSEDNIGSKKKQRAYALAALYMALSHENVKEALESHWDDYTEAGQHHAQNILLALETLKSLEKDSGLRMLDPKMPAMYFNKSEGGGSRPPVPEIVINYIPEEISDNSLPRYMKTILEARLESNLEGGGSVEERLSHELTHYYIDKGVEFKLEEHLVEPKDGGKPYIDGINEAAAYAITYLTNPNIEKGQSAGFNVARAYRKRSNVPGSVVENYARALLKTTSGYSGKERIQKIRNEALGLIKSGIEGDLKRIEEIGEGELDEEFKKGKQFNVARERANRYIADSMLFLGVIEEDEAFPNQDTSETFKEELNDIKDLLGDLESLGEDNEKIRDLHEDLSLLISIYESEDKEFHEEFGILEKEGDDENELVKNYKAAFFGEYDWDSHISEMQEDYEELIEELEKGLNKILEVLKKLEKDESDEARVIEESDNEDLKKIIFEAEEDTKHAFKIVKNAKNDLEKAKRILENYESLGEKP